MSALNSPTTTPVQSSWRWALIPVVWLVVALLSSLQTHMSALAHGNPQPWLPAFGNTLLWYAGWAAVTPLVVRMARRFPLPGTPGSRFAVAHIAGAIATALIHAAIYSALSATFYEPQAGAPSNVEMVFLRLASHGHVYALSYAIIVGVVLGARAYRGMRDREVDAAQLEVQLAEAETAALRAQLQPHFLFNTLNAISALVPDEPLTAQRMIARLGDLLRISIEQHRASESTLAEEMEFTNLYLAIEQMRLGDRLRIVRQISPEAETATVPSLVLQPLVENAVLHGVAPLVRGGTIEIAAHRVGGTLRLSVADDGAGTRHYREGVGLGNARARLRRMYGDAHTFEVETAPGKGFCVTVQLPA